MTDCGCEKARQDLEEYLRNEMCRTEHSDIREHLEKKLGIPESERHICEGRQKVAETRLVEAVRVYRSEDQSESGTAQFFGRTASPANNTRS